jgi:hypothetical protein
LDDNYNELLTDTIKYVYFLFYFLSFFFFLFYFLSFFFFLFTSTVFQVFDLEAPFKFSSKSTPTLLKKKIFKVSFEHLQVSLIYINHLIFVKILMKSISLCFFNRLIASFNAFPLESFFFFKFIITHYIAIFAVFSNSGSDIVNICFLG